LEEKLLSLVFKMRVQEENQDLFQQAIEEVSRRGVVTDTLRLQKETFTVSNYRNSKSLLRLLGLAMRELPSMLNSNEFYSLWKKR